MQLFRTVRRLTYVKRKERRDNMQSKKKRQLVEETILSSYESMYRIAFTYVKNQEDAMDFLSRKKREVSMDNPEYYIQGASWDSYEDMDLKRALDKLNSKERTIVLLRFFEDKKLEEIAEVLRLKTNTVKSILYRSIQKLEIEMTKGEKLS